MELYILCPGLTDGGVLSITGKMQAYLCGHALAAHNINCIYSGAAPLERECAEYAALSCCAAVERLPDDGIAALTKYTGESCALVLKREDIIKLLSRLLHRDISQAPGALNRLIFKEGEFFVSSYDEAPKVPLKDTVIDGLTEIAQVGQGEKMRNMRICAYALQLADKIDKGYHGVDSTVLKNACLLRSIGESPACCANILDRLGYRAEAETLRYENVLPDEKLYMISEAMILFLALRMEKSQGEISAYLGQCKDKNEAEQTEFVIELLSCAMQNSCIKQGGT